MAAVDAMLSILLITFLVVFWLKLIAFLRQRAGMRVELDVVTGIPLRSSRWGSAVINGVGAKRCIKIEEYGEGYLIRMMKVFGGGVLWIPKNELRLSEERRSQLLLPRSRILASGPNRIVLLNDLADFIDAAALPERP